MASSIIVLRCGRQLLSVFYCTISGQVLQEFLLADVSPLQLHLQHVTSDVTSLLKFEHPQSNMLAGVTADGGVVLMDLVLMQAQRLPTIASFVTRSKNSLVLVETRDGDANLTTLSFLFAAASLPAEYLNPSRIRAIRRFQQAFRRILSERRAMETLSGRSDFGGGSSSVDFEDDSVWRDASDTDASPSRNKSWAEPRPSWSFPSAWATGLESAYRSFLTDTSSHTSIATGDAPPSQPLNAVHTEVARPDSVLELHFTDQVPDTSLTPISADSKGIFVGPSESFEICVSASQGLGLSLRVRDDLRSSNVYFPYTLTFIP